MFTLQREIAVRQLESGWRWDGGAFIPNEPYYVRERQQSQLDSPLRTQLFFGFDVSGLDPTRAVLAAYLVIHQLDKLNDLDAPGNASLLEISRVTEAWDTGGSNNPDSDADGFTDGQELGAGLDPNRPTFVETESVELGLAEFLTVGVDGNEFDPASQGSWGSSGELYVRERRPGDGSSHLKTHLYVRFDLGGLDPHKPIIEASLKVHQIHRRNAVAANIGQLAVGGVVDPEFAGVAFAADDDATTAEDEAFELIVQQVVGETAGPLGGSDIVGFSLGSADVVQGCGRPIDLPGRSQAVPFKSRLGKLG